MRSLSSARLQRVTQLCHALSDPTRVQILSHLARGDCCVCDLTDVLDAAQPRLSFHLKVLKDARIIADRRAGRWVYYSLLPGALAEAEEFMEQVEERARATAGSACCD
jgi:ArsR family transcriptional regulator